MRLPPLPTIKDILRVYKIRALKNLSQNFLLNERICKKIVKTAGNLKDFHVCEVGPGPGGITRSILEAGVKHLTVVEKDRRFVPSLELIKECSDVPLDIIRGDILHTNLETIFPGELTTDWDQVPPKIHIIGNLPFSVSTILIIRWLECISQRTNAWKYGRTQMTLTFQKEIGERMIAAPNDPQRSRLSVICQNYCDVKLKHIIKGTAFVPKPEVDVAVMHFTPRVKPQINLPFKVIQNVLRCIFQHPNKYFSNCVVTLIPPERPELLEEIGERTCIPHNIEPRELTTEDWYKICHAYNDICIREPEILDYNFRSMKNAKNFNMRHKIWRSIYGTNVEELDSEVENSKNVTNAPV